METLKIIGGVIVGFIILIHLLNMLVDSNRRKQFRHWRIGDKILLYKNNVASRTLENYRKEYAELLGWSTDYLYLDCGDGITNQVKWNVMEGNKSAAWRKNFDDAKKEMGINPAFPYDAMSLPEYSNDDFLIPISKKFQGKDISLMTETECQVYLKIAIDNDDYSTAELIRKRLENFR